MLLGKLLTVALIILTILGPLALLGLLGLSGLRRSERGDRALSIGSQLAWGSELRRRVRS